jgi:hypothetical protein
MRAQTPQTPPQGGQTPKGRQAVSVYEVLTLVITGLTIYGLILQISLAREQRARERARRREEAREREEELV